MACETDDVNQLVGLLRKLTDADYEALASKGLLRRARKDVGAAALRGVVGGDALVDVGEQRVTIPPAGPSKAKCTCPSPGVCQHIIAACLCLSEMDPSPMDSTSGELVSEEGGSGDPFQEWISMDVECVRKWAGSDGWKACRTLISRAKVEDSASGSVIVVFGDGASVRLLPGVGLDGAIADVPARLRRRYVAAAALACRSARGMSVELGESDAFVLDTSLVKGVEEQLCDMVRIGLNHLSPDTCQRLGMLSTHCRSSRLYRLSKELESCATEVDLLVRRDGGSDSERFIYRVARCFALCQSLMGYGSGAPEYLVGSGRTEYSAVGELELVGLGAYAWESPSGFHGVTGIFWDPVAGVFLSWSDARPAAAGDGFAPDTRFRGEAPWAGGLSLEQCVHGVVRVNAPRINGERRISSSSKTRILGVGAQRRELLPPAFVNWAKMRQEMQSLRRVGLRRPVPLDSVVCLRPKRFKKPAFDEITQTLLWPMEDEEGNDLCVMLPFQKENVAAIHWIEKNHRRPGSFLVGYYTAIPSEGVVPVSLIADENPCKVSSPFFAEVPQSKGWWLKKKPPKRAKWNVFSVEDDEPVVVSALDQLLHEVGNELISRCEAGSAVVEKDFGPIADRLRDAGLIVLARAISRVGNDPGHLLSAVYIQDLCRSHGGDPNHYPPQAVVTR